LGGDVARREAGAAGREHDCGLVCELLDRAGDLAAFVRNDAPDHLVALGFEQLLEQVAARVLARPLGDTVRNGQDRRIHRGSWVFSPSLPSSTTMPLSIALAMSYTVSAATDAATSASISTPVRATVSALAVISTPSPTISASTRTTESGSWWQSGIRS